MRCPFLLHVVRGSAWRIKTLEEFPDLLGRIEHVAITVTAFFIF